MNVWTVLLLRLCIDSQLLGEPKPIFIDYFLIRTLSEVHFYLHSIVNFAIDDDSLKKMVGNAINHQLTKSIALIAQFFMNMQDLATQIGSVGIRPRLHSAMDNTQGDSKFPFESFQWNVTNNFSFLSDVKEKFDWDVYLAKANELEAVPSCSFQHVSLADCTFGQLSHEEKNQ